MFWLFFSLSSTACWAWVNVLDSTLVRWHEKNPIVVMWSQSLFSVIFLSVFSIFLDTHTSWWWVLAAVGVLAYVGDLVFFYLLDRVDVSVSNGAWAILSLLLTFVGLFFFGEQWSIAQTVGAVLMISGVLLLSFWHQHVSLTRTVFLLTLLAVLYVPFYAVKKAAVLDGQAASVVFFWLMLGRETTSFTFPWLVGSLRSKILKVKKKTSHWYSGLNGLVIALFLLAEYLGARAYSAGAPISVAAVVSDIQPFVVIFFGWLLYRFLPGVAPKELLTARSVGLKVLCFTIVSVGLALLTLF